MDTTLSNLVAAVRAHPTEFYKSRWGRAERFHDLPQLSRADFLATPLSQRRYKSEKSLVKIVRDVRGPFLSQWSFRDIAKEAYGVPSVHPFVYMSDAHEAVEKAMWCYEHHTVPLIGEQDPDLAMYAAAAYRIDSLIVDPLSLPRLLPLFSRLGRLLSSISIIGSSFAPAALMPFSAYAETVRLVLALPECGAFAEAHLSTKPHFKTLPDCVIEKGETLVLTKRRTLTTPVIKYDTGISSDTLALV